jgi:hypothetical protein
MLLTATNVRRACASEKGWREVWAEMRGAPREDTSQIMRVQLGIHVEPFIADWTQRLHPLRLRNPYEGLPENHHSYRREQGGITYSCRPDGFVVDTDEPWEAKLTAMQVAMALPLWSPQIAVTMFCCDKPTEQVSVLWGMERLTLYAVGRSDEYWAALHDEMERLVFDVATASAADPPEQPFSSRFSLDWRVVRVRKNGQRDGARSVTAEQAVGDQLPEPDPRPNHGSTIGGEPAAGAGQVAA